MLSIPFVFPFLVTAFSSRVLFRQAAVSILVGFCTGYGILALGFLLWCGSSHTANPVGFYTTYWVGSKLGFSDHALIIHKFVTGIVALFTKSQLFFLAPALVGCVLYWRFIPARNLALAALTYIAVPVLLYSTDRYALPAARYFIFAVPLIVLAAFLALQELTKGKHRQFFAWIYPAFAVGSAVALNSSFGVPWANLKWPSVVSRARYLDFPGASDALAANFSRDDIVIINHALPTGLSRLHNILYVPAFQHFLKGDNHRIEGMVFVYSPNPPNDFFTPKDWLVDGAPPPVLRDDHGLSYQRVFLQSSKLQGPDGVLQSEAFFVVYRKSGASPPPAT